MLLLEGRWVNRHLVNNNGLCRRIACLAACSNKRQLEVSLIGINTEHCQEGYVPLAATEGHARVVGAYRVLILLISLAKSNQYFRTH
jgi:hypothetical protein